MSDAAVLKGITKTFGAVTALDSVDFTARYGQIQALVGENGAGKTTVMRVLYGALQPDAGTVEVDGREVRFHRAADGINAGIGMVSQHYAIIPELTCLENLMLGAEPGWAISVRKAELRAKELADQMGFRFDWHRPAAGLSPGDAQKLEILRLLWRNSKIMILDEPTAMLSPQDADALYRSLRKLAEEGACVIVVTHRIAEVLSHCERVTVLRGGRLQAELPVAETNAAQLAELIVGRAVDDPQITPFEPGEPVLELSGFTVLGDRKEEAVKQANLTLRAGEVLGLAGVDGSGQRELFQAILGIRAYAGNLTIYGEDAKRQTTAERIKRGLRMIHEDRHTEAVIEAWSLEANAALGLQRLDFLTKGSQIDRTKRREFAQACADRFHTKHESLGQPMGGLSGGNQQRFVAARALISSPRLILAFQPARGLDIAASRSVYQAIREECRKGAAALIVSFDLDELLEECDRVAAICGGQINLPPAGRERDRAAIGALMVGATA